MCGLLLSNNIVGVIVLANCFTSGVNYHIVILLAVLIETTGYILVVLLI